MTRSPCGFRKCPKCTSEWPTPSYCGRRCCPHCQAAIDAWRASWPANRELRRQAADLRTQAIKETRAARVAKLAPLIREQGLSYRQAALCLRTTKNAISSLIARNYKAIHGFDKRRAA